VRAQHARGDGQLAHARAGRLAAAAPLPPAPLAGALPPAPACAHELMRMRQLLGRM
jgi:hypothetical protein